MEDEDVLDEFGKLLVKSVRDEVLGKYGMIMDGTVKSARADEIRRQLKAFGDIEIQRVQNVLSHVVDDVIHSTLWMLEQNEDKLELAVRDVTGSPRNLVSASDGLAGELYSEDGWIARFSGHPLSEVE